MAQMEKGIIYCYFIKKHYMQDTHEENPYIYIYNLIIFYIVL